MKQPNNRKLFGRGVAMAAVAVLLLAAGSAKAANTADNLTNTSSTATLIVGNSWSLGSVPAVSNDAVWTGIGGTGIRTMSAGNLTVGSFNVTTNGGTFSIRNNTSTATDSILTLGGAGNLGNSVSGTAADLLYAASGSTFTMIATNGVGGTGVLKLTLGQSGNFNAAGTMNIYPVISDGGNAYSISKNGSGTLTLSGANTFTGSTTVSGGILTLGLSTALQNSALDTLNSIAGTSTTGLKTTVTALTLGGLTGNKNLADLFTTTSGGYGSVTALTLNPPSGTASYSGVIANGAANMTLTKSGAGTQTLSGTNTYAGGTMISNGELHIVESGSVVGNITNNSPFAGGLTYDKAGSYTTTNTITGAGGLTVMGGGTNKFTVGSLGGCVGNTTVTNATARFNHTDTYSGVITAENGGTVGGTGTVAAVFMEAGSTLSPGNSVGTLTVTDTLTLNNGSTSVFEFASAILYDRVVETNLTFEAAAGHPILNLTGSAFSATNNVTTFTLFDVVSSAGLTLNGNFFLLNGGTLLTNNATFSSAVLLDAGQKFRINYDVTVIPEPTTLQLLMFLGTAFALRRKLRQPK
ncbi:MAG: autotransporter-associated beta strand repeat-containing protein [Kiritimatiellaeota bacterium]|nr:autotransporter-associated beta strand repeat-containing protein [Kiritimatiellota bacterium]